MSGRDLSLLCVLGCLSGVLGHGRLIKPPSRASMWRYGWNNPPDYSDNQGFCGGVGVQYSAAVGGRCGICGDPYNGKRDHEAGGKYANGVIVDTYKQGSDIEVDVDITANHKGFIQFKLCPHNDPSTPATQDCLDRYPLKVKGTQDVKVDIGTTKGVIRTVVELPKDVLCTQCVLQWRYHTGNSWGCDSPGDCCVGCGNQEEFYACADIAISKTGKPYPGSGAPAPRPKKPGPPSPNPPTLPPGGGSCRATGPWTGDAGMDDWCARMCPLGQCPETHCTCA